MQVFGGQPGTPSSTHPAKRLSLRADPLVIWPLATITLLALMFASSASAQKGHPAPPVGPPHNAPTGPIGQPYGYGGYGSTGAESTANPGFGYDPFEIENKTVETLPPFLPVDTESILRAESCEDWTAASVDSPTVSVARLAVPGKASGQFQKACGSYKKNQFSDAEGHVREALKIYPDYAAAWVLLGQIYFAENKDAEGRAACNQAKSLDSKYAPPYICLADFATRAKNWRQAYELSDYALSLDPITDLYAYMYVADAELHLDHLDAAESNAEYAEKLDKWHKAPQIHLLLAQIYEAKGSRAEEISELRQFLKIEPHAAGASVARATLAKVEGSPAK
jgi:tetratricopeptide (TPR) repeat protein